MNRFKIVIALTWAAVLLPVLDCRADSADGDDEVTSSDSFYVGVGLGAAQISEDTVLINDSSTAYKVFAGYSLNDYVGFEASYTMLDSVYEYYPFASALQTSVADGNSFNASAIVTVPVSERFRVNGKAGLASWSADSNDSGLEDSGTDAAIGFGLEYRARSAVSVRLDFDFSRFGDADVYIGSVSLGYRF